MRTKSRLHALGAVLVLALSQNAAICAPLTEPGLRAVLAQTCSEVNDFYRSEHFPILAPSPAACTFLFRNNDDYKEQVGVFNSTENALLTAEILSTSGRVVKFSNLAASHAYYSSPLVEGLPPPKWTQAHAIEIATKFASIFLKSWDARLMPPVAKFAWPVQVRNTARPGKWTVAWYRESLSGVPIYGDAVVVDISEQYGPESIGIWLALHYDEEKIKPIAADKALTEARRGLDEILGWDAAKKWLPDSQIQGEPIGPWLTITRPNFDLKGKEGAPPNQLDARLAWAVRYNVQSKDNPNFKGNVTVYIDAKDGSFLGGYF